MREIFLLKRKINVLLNCKNENVKPDNTTNTLARLYRDDNSLRVCLTSPVNALSICDKMRISVLAHRETKIPKRLMIF